MKFTSLSTVGRVPSENICRSGKLFTDNTALVTLATALSVGFKPELGVAITYVLDAKGQEAAVKELETEYTYWKEFQEVLEVTDLLTGKKVKVAPVHLIRAFEAIHVDGKGKIRAPRAGYITCNRRSMGIIVTNAMLMVQGKPVITEIPAVEQEFRDALARGEACIAGNNIDNGREKLNGRDITYAALKMYLLGGTESALTRALGGKRGTAQKAWSLIELNHRFPDQKITDKVIADEIEWGSLDKEVMRKMAHGDKKNGTNPANAEEVAAYFANPRAERSNDPKILDKNTMDGLIARFPVQLVQDVLFSVRHNKAENLSKYIDHAAVINALTQKLGLTPPPPPAVAEKK